MRYQFRLLKHKRSSLSTFKSLVQSCDYDGLIKLCEDSLQLEGDPTLEKPLVLDDLNFAMKLEWRIRENNGPRAASNSYNKAIAERISVPWVHYLMLKQFDPKIINLMLKFNLFHTHKVTRHSVRSVLGTYHDPDMDRSVFSSSNDNFKQTDRSYEIDTLSLLIYLSPDEECCKNIINSIFDKKGHESFQTQQQSTDTQISPVYYTFKDSININTESNNGSQTSLSISYWLAEYNIEHLRMLDAKTLYANISPMMAALIKGYAGVYNLLTEKGFQLNANEVSLFLSSTFDKYALFNILNSNTSIRLNWLNIETPNKCNLMQDYYSREVLINIRQAIIKGQIILDDNIEILDHWSPILHRSLIRALYCETQSDFVESFTYLKEASQKKCAYASIKLSEYCIAGKGCEVDKNTALDYAFLSLQQADTELESDIIKQALLQLRNACDISELMGKANRLLGKYYENVCGKNNVAIEYYKKAIEDPEEVEATISLAKIYFKRKKYKKATELDYGPAYTILARAKFKAGAFDDALDYYHHAILAFCKPEIANIKKEVIDLINRSGKNKQKYVQMIINALNNSYLNYDDDKAINEFLSELRKIKVDTSNNLDDPPQYNEPDKHIYEDPNPLPNNNISEHSLENKGNAPSFVSENSYKSLYEKERFKNNTLSNRNHDLDQDNSELKNEIKDLKNKINLSDTSENQSRNIDLEQKESIRKLKSILRDMILKSPTKHDEAHNSEKPNDNLSRTRSCSL